MIKITKHIHLPSTEVKLRFVTSGGPGGQNVNKVATAAHLRFNVLHSPSLPEAVRARLIILAGERLSRDGDLIIKAHRHRTQARNKQDAISRLQEIIQRAATPPKKRKKSKPPLAAKKRRLSNKKQQAQKKENRRHKEWE